MMSTQYRDSGAEWIGLLPNRWEIKPAFAVLDELDEKNDKGQVQNVLSLSYGKIIRRDVESNVGLLPQSFNTYQIVREGDIVLRLLDLQNDHVSLRVGLVPEQGIVTSAYLAVRPKACLDSRFAAYLLHAYDIKKVFYSFGGGCRQSMGFEDLRRLPIPLPSLVEQRRIAAYLDAATGRVDRLVSLRRRQMELLREQRAALIQQAVTSGLNPSAPFKDSGLPWLGQIPKHWQCSALRRFWSVTDCKHLTVPFLDEGIPLASVSEVQSFDLDLSQAKMTSEESYRVLIEGERQPRRGDVIYCRNTSVGAAAYVPTDEPLAMGQDVCLIRSMKQNGRFLVYQLRSAFMSEQLNTILIGATFKRINVADIKALAVVCPPRKEQDAIVEYLDAAGERTNRLLAAYTRQMGLLAEQRAALIHECVTGQRAVSDASVVALARS
jgi:type I restriction enzyme S subunit